MCFSKENSEEKFPEANGKDEKPKSIRMELSKDYLTWKCLRAN